MPTTDILQELIGQWGRFQSYVLVMIFGCRIGLGWHTLGIIFLAPPVEFACLDGHSINDSLVFDSKCPCKEPLFDNTIFVKTIISYWHLICNDSWMASFSQFMFMFGYLVGSMLCGGLSDLYGRRLILFYSTFFLTVSGIIAGVLSEYWSFVVLRVIEGANSGGVMVVSYVLLMEYVGPKYRETVNFLAHLPVNIGHLILVGFGYALRDFQAYQVMLSVPMGVFLLYYCFLPESLKWLISQKHKQPAMTLLGKILKMNKQATQNIEALVDEEINAHGYTKKATLLDIFRKDKLFRNFGCMAVNYFSSGLGYYGISQYIGRMQGDIFVNVATSAVLLSAGTILSTLLLKATGRRRAMVISNLTGSTCIMSLALIPLQLANARVLVACLGNSCIFVSFIVEFLYSVELFPTQVRNGAIGLLCMVSRIGSMVAPFVNNLPAFWAPPLLFAIFPLFGALLSVWLPETKGHVLPVTVEEVD